jgi:proteic killer suppression protein
VISSFKHRGLKRLYDDDDHRGLSLAHVDKIKRVSARLDEAVEVRNMALPGFGLHRLKGKLRGRWAVSVSGTGVSSFVSTMAKLTTWISSTITRRENNHANEKPASSRFVCSRGLS